MFFKYAVKIYKIRLFPFEIGTSALPAGKCDLLIITQRYYNKHKNKMN